MPPRDHPFMNELSPSAAGSPQLRLLGDPTLVGADGSIKALERRAAGLLALVALEPGVTRARAAALLWPDSDNARQALRQQIARFKKNYGAELVTGTDALFIADGVTVDALQAVGGVLLGELSFDDCEDFAEWLARQRTQRRSGTTSVLVQQIAAAEAQGDLEAATRLAEQLLLADNDSEAHHRTLMRLHYLRGDIAQAQAAYERLARLLRTRFGAQPASETEQLARALRAAQPTVRAVTAAPPPLRPVPVTLLRPPRMIGRQRELAALAAAWAEGRAALLLGEPGLGKSRLLAEFAAGRRVLGVQGRPGDAGVPYATLSRLLRTILERAPIELPAPRRTELARLLPELSPALPLPADGQRLLLQGAVEAVLAQAQAEGALADGLIIDDLHFADEASVEMLQALICSSAPATAALRWALAQRPGEGSPAATALRAALAEAQALDAVPLAPLTINEMAELIDSLGLPELDSAQLAPQLTRHTGGNPLYALETLKQGLASGLLQQGRLPTPVNVGALIERRLKQLSERALALARVAAIAGVDFSIALAEEVMGVRAVELADAWSELEAAQVLRENAFAHDLVYDAVLRSVPGAIARHLHAATAEFLETRGGTPGRLAEHWIQAGRDDRAGPMLVEAAALAYRATRPAEAAVALERALALRGWTDAAARFAAASSRCEALFDVDLGTSLSHALEQLDVHAQTEAQRTTALRLRAQVALYRGDDAQARDLGQQAAAIAARTGDDIEYLVARSVAARGAARTGATAEAIAMMRADAERAQRAGEAVQCEHSGILAILLQLAMRVQESQVEIETAATLARKLGRWADLSNLLGNQAANCNFTGRFEDALRLYRESLQLTESRELQGVATQFTAMNIAMTLIELNRYDEAWDWLQRAEADVQRDAPAFAPLVAAFRARWYLELGQGSRAARALDAFPDDAATPAYVTSYRCLVRACIEADAAHDPAHWIARAVGLAAGAGRPFVLWEARLNAAALGCVAAAGDLRELARSARNHGFAAHELAALAIGGAGNGDATAGDDAAFEQLTAGAHSRWIYRGRLLLALLGHTWQPAQAERLCAFASAWLHRTQTAFVPAEFREAFLHRNPVNRALVDALRRQGAAHGHALTITRSAAD